MYPQTISCQPLGHTARALRAFGTIALLVALLHSIQPAQAQSSVRGDEVIVQVGDAYIREADVALALQFFARQLEQVDPSERRERMIQYLIDRKLMVKDAQSKGVDQRPETRRLASFYLEEAVRNVYLEEHVFQNVDEDDLRAWYKEYVAELEQRVEVQASHILVNELADAQDIVKKARGGADFAELARKHSTGPTSERGGDLGYFEPRRMVPAFAEAVTRMNVGTISEPVKTQFGWHVIKKVAERPVEIPPLDEIRGGGYGMLREQENARVLNELRNKTNIRRSQ